MFGATGSGGRHASEAGALFGKSITGRNAVHADSGTSYL